MLSARSAGIEVSTTTELSSSPATSAGTPRKMATRPFETPTYHWVSRYRRNPTTPSATIARVTPVQIPTFRPTLPDPGRERSGRRSVAGRSVRDAGREVGATGDPGRGSGIGAPTIVMSDRFEGAAGAIGRSIVGSRGIADPFVAPGPPPSFAKSRIRAVMLSMPPARLA